MLTFAKLISLRCEIFMIYDYMMMYLMCLLCCSNTCVLSSYLSLAVAETTHLDRAVRRLLVVAPASAYIHVRTKLKLVTCDHKQEHGCLPAGTCMSW